MIYTTLAHTHTHAQHTQTLDQLAEIGYEGITYKCSLAGRSFTVRVRVGGPVADQLALATFLKWPGSSSPFRAGWSQSLSGWFGFVFYQAETDPTFQAVEDKRSAYKQLLDGYMTDIKARLATGTRQPAENSQMKRAVRMASMFTKKMMLTNPNTRESLLKCSMLSPQLHIVAYVIRCALSLHCVYLLPAGSPVRAAIEAVLHSTAELQGEGVAVVTNKTLRLLIAEYAQSLYAETQQSPELWKRVAGLLVLLTARFVQAVYRDTKESNTLELRLTAHTMTMFATFFSARVGGSEPSKFQSPKYIEKHLAGFKVHTDNLYYFAAMTLLVATQELLHEKNLSLRGANEDHGERAIQDGHVDFMGITRSKCNLLGDQRLTVVRGVKSSVVKKRKVEGLHNPLLDVVKILDVCRCSCLITGKHMLEVIDPKTHKTTRELPFFSFNNRAFDRQLTDANNALVYLLRSGHTLFCVGEKPSDLRAAVVAGRYVDKFDRAAHSDVLFLCVCGKCNLKPSVEPTSNTLMTRDFNVLDLRTKQYQVSGVQLRREFPNILSSFAARKVKVMVAGQPGQPGRGKLFFPLFQFRTACRRVCVQTKCGPDSDAGQAYLRKVVDRKLDKIAALSTGTNSWVTNYNLVVQVESLEDVIVKRGLTDVEVPVIPADRVMKLDKRPLLSDGTRGTVPRKKPVDRGFCGCATRKCKGCVCARAVPPRPCTARCHGRAESDRVCGNRAGSV